MTDLTVSEAATVAGVSVRTVRRWIASGQVATTGRGRRKRLVAASLSKQTAANGRNGHVGVTLSDIESDTTVTETVSAANSDKADLEAGHLAVLVRELSERLADQTALTAIWQERALVLSDQLALAAPTAPETVEPPTNAANTLWALLTRWWWVVSVLALVLALAAVLLSPYGPLR